MSSRPTPPVGLPSQAPRQPELDADTRRRLAGQVAMALQGSPFASRERLGWAVAILRSSEPPRATSRPDFASWLRANDLPQLATECLHRKVPRGSVLVYVEADTETASGAYFFVFDLDAVVRSHVRPA